LVEGLALRIEHYGIGTLGGHEYEYENSAEGNKDDGQHDGEGATGLREGGVTVKG